MHLGCPISKKKREIRDINTHTVLKLFCLSSSTHFRPAQLHKQFGQKHCIAAHFPLLVLHERYLFGVLKVHFHNQQAAKRTRRREIQTVKEQAETGAGVTEVLLVYRLEKLITSIFKLITNKLVLYTCSKIFSMTLLITK